MLCQGDQRHLWRARRSSRSPTGKTPSPRRPRAAEVLRRSAIQHVLNMFKVSRLSRRTSRHDRRVNSLVTPLERRTKVAVGRLGVLVRLLTSSLGTAASCWTRSWGEYHPTGRLTDNAIRAKAKSRVAPSRRPVTRRSVGIKTTPVVLSASPQSLGADGSLCRLRIPSYLDSSIRRGMRHGGSAVFQGTFDAFRA